MSMSKHYFQLLFYTIGTTTICLYTRILLVVVVIRVVKIRKIHNVPQMFVKLSHNLSTEQEDAMHTYLVNLLNIPMERHPKLF